MITIFCGLIEKLCIDLFDAKFVSEENYGSLDLIFSNLDIVIALLLNMIRTCDVMNPKLRTKLIITTNNTLYLQKQCI